MEQAEWTNTFDTFAPDYRFETVGRSLIVRADCFEWLQRIPEESLHAVVTDPPYGVKEYELDQIEKRTEFPHTAQGLGQAPRGHGTFSLSSRWKG